MKNLTKPVLAAATIAALASGLALAQGGIASAATTASDCAVAVSLPTAPIAVTTAATTTIPITTTWTGACTTELNKSATATYAFSSAATADATSSTPITAIATFTSRTLTQNTGTTDVAVPTSALPAVGSFLKLQLQSSTTTKDSTVPTPEPTTTPTPSASPTATPTADPITFATKVDASSNAELVKSGTTADIKYSRDGKSLVIVGHAYTYTATTRVGQSAAIVRLQKLVGTEYQTVAASTTSSTGRYQFSVADTAASTYRVATSDSATVAGSVSPSVTAAVFTQADTKVIRLSTSKVAKKATIAGTLFVRSSVTGNFKATSGVAANLEKKLNGTWVKVKKVRSTTAGSISAVANNVHKTAYRFVVIQNSSYKTSTSTSISR